MKILFIGVGVFSILLGLLNFITPPRMVYFALASLIGGIVLIIAGFKRYRGEWPTFIGALIIFLGAYSFNIGIDYSL